MFIAAVKHQNKAESDAGGLCEFLSKWMNE